MEAREDMEKSDITSGPTHRIHIYRHAQCRVKGRYAYRNIWKNRDHLYVVYIAIVQAPNMTAIVDTGVANIAKMNEGAGFLLTKPMWQEPGEDTLSILEKAGIVGEAVDYVFLTHCHYDHCSNLNLFPNANIVIPEHAWNVWHEQPDGANYLHDGFLEELEDLNAAGRLIRCDEGLITPGIGVRYVGGHCPCSQFVYINTEQGVAVLTGDTVQMVANLEQNDVIGIWYDDEECWNALDIARSTADIVLPGHDPRVFERYPNGIIE